MKLLLATIASLLFAGLAPAQMITVTSTGLADSSGNPITNATVYFTPALANGNPASYRRGTGQGQTVMTKVHALVTNGAFSILLADTSQTNPVNVCYAATVVSNVSGVNLLGPGYSCVQPTSATGSGWCSGTACNFDLYTPNLAPLVAVSPGPKGDKGDTGAVGPAGGALNAHANGWNVNLPGQYAYWEGPSTLRCPHSGGTFVAGAPLAQGGCAGNYAADFMSDIWASGNFAGYANDGVDGSTSTLALARWSTGNSSYGVAVPSAQSMSPSVTGSNARAIFFLDLGIVYNDQNAGTTLATSVSNVAQIISNAHNAGYFVVVLTTPLVIIGNETQTDNIKAVNRDAYSGAFSNDLTFRLDLLLGDVTDTAFYDIDFIHPTTNGDKTIAQYLTAFMIGGGSATPYYPFYSDPLFAVDRMNVSHGQETPCLVSTVLTINCPLGSNQPFPEDLLINAETDSFQNVTLARDVVNPQSLNWGVNQSTHRSSIDSIQYNVGPTPLDLNPSGGLTNLGGPLSLQGGSSVNGIHALSATDTTRTPVPAGSCIDYELSVAGALANAYLTAFTASGSLMSLSLETQPDPSTAGKINLHYCNPGTVSVTPQALTFKWLQLN